MPDSRPDLAAVVNRIKRAQGQLAGVLRMIDEGRDVDAVLQQLKAVTGALDRAGFAIVAADLAATVDDAGGSVDAERLARLEKLFLTLA